MKTERKIELALGLISILLAAGIFAGSVSKDSEPPVITYPEEHQLTYHSGEPREDLLEDVEAEDNCDGDIKDSLRVYSIQRVSDDQAVVVYAAKDSSQNIGKVSRKIAYIAAEEKEETGDEKVSGDEKEIPDTDAEEKTTEDEDLKGPVLKLAQNEVTKKVGEKFNILQYVESAKDTDGSNLSKRIHVDGNVDMKTPGIYPLSVYAIGMDNQQSNIEKFILTVESAEENE